MAERTGATLVPVVPTLDGGRPRRWPHRVLLSFIVVAALATVGAGATYFYVRHQLGKINRIDVAGLSNSGGGPMNVLLVGSDSRDRVTGQLAETTGKGQVSGQRSDTLMVLHVESGETKAAIVSIPRDLYVPIAGTNGSDRVNTAFSRGGADTLVATIEGALAIDIHHYVEIDFVGFRDIVDAVGGVNVAVDTPVRDRVSGLTVEEAGCARLDGTDALALVRSRNYEKLVDGRWTIDPTGDLGRIERQQDFIRRMMSKVVSSGLKNPLRLNRLVNVGTRDLTLDRGMSSGDLLKLARRFRSLDSSTVDMVTLPTRGANVGGASVLLLKKDEAKPIIDRLNGVTPPPPPTTVAVKSVATTKAAPSGSTPTTAAVAPPC